MGRFSPTVTPTWGESLSQALGQGVGTYLQSRNLRRQQDEQMLLHGYQPESDEEQQARQAYGQQQRSAGITSAPQSTTSQSLAAALNPQLGLHAPAAPVQQVAPETPVSIGGIGYRMTPEARQRMMLAMALQQAEIGSKNAETYKNTREGGALRLGDTGYAPAKGAEAGAVAAAQVPAKVTEAQQIALATLPIKIREMVVKGQIDLNTALSTVSARGNVEKSLASSRQTFEQGQQTRALAAEAERQRTGLAGAFGNSIAEAGAKLGPIARLERSALGAPQLPTTPPPLPPLGGAGQAGPSQAQQLWDAAVKLHGQKKVLAEYGPRPE